MLEIKQLKHLMDIMSLVLMMMMNYLFKVRGIC